MGWVLYPWLCPLPYLAQTICHVIRANPAATRQGRDWAANAVPPQEVIDLKQVTKDNPFYRYTFHPIDKSFPLPYSHWQTTLRQPTDRSATATDNVPRMKSILQASQSNITSSTYSMLTRVHTWPAFSNHTVGDRGSTSNSLEAIHDGIHVDVGGNGHMGDPAVAGFDPIFFLHHCNVDRMLSLWAALNPGVWVSRGNSESGTITIPPDTSVDTTTGLTPFWQAQTAFWASSGTTDVVRLGYTCPEFNGLDMANPQAVKTAIAKIVNQKYGSPIFSSFAALPALAAGTSQPQKPLVAAARQPEPAPSAPVHVSEEALAAIGHQGPGPQAGHVDIAPPNHGLYDWTARIEFKKHELGSSFSVLLFLGAVPEDPEQWPVSENFVGAHHAFVNSATAQCANCVDQQDLVEEGFVHLNHAIAARSGLGSLDPEVVEPYLMKELHWRVQKTDASVAQLESLEVSVYGTPLSYPPGAMFPVPGQRRRHNRITHGRTGGSRNA